MYKARSIINFFTFYSKLAFHIFQLSLQGIRSIVFTAQLVIKVSIIIDSFGWTLKLFFRHLKGISLSHLPISILQLYLVLASSLFNHVFPFITVFQQFLFSHRVVLGVQIELIIRLGRDSVLISLVIFNFSFVLEQFFKPTDRNHDQ